MSLLKVTSYLIRRLQKERHKVVLSGKVKADEHRVRYHISGWEDHASSNLKFIDFATGIMNGYNTWGLESDPMAYIHKDL